MTITVEPSTGAEAELSFSDQLLAVALDPREQVAVRALAAEEGILSRDTVRQSLVYTTPQGALGLAWQRLSVDMYGLGLPVEELAFLDLVLSMTGVAHSTSLVRAMDLDEQRLAIILRAMIQLSGCDSLAVGTRT